MTSKTEKIGRIKNANFLYILTEKSPNKKFSSYDVENLLKSAQGPGHTPGRRLFKYLQFSTNVSGVHCKKCAINFGLPL
jgi:hypothetical protein